MDYETGLRSAFTSLALLIILCVTGCSAVREARVINHGEKVQVEYTCRFTDGGIVATTSEKVAENEAMEKSRLFRANDKGYQPLVTIAGGKAEALASPEDKYKGFQEHIADHLDDAVVGFHVGQTKTVEIHGNLVPGLSNQDRFLDLARIWRYDKKEVVSRQEYEEIVGKEPELGYEIPWRPPFIARVDKISDKFVRFHLELPAGAEMNTAWGKGEITDRGEHYEVVIDAHEGRLVRLGPLIGRIVEVGEKLFKIDYGYPFGNEPLLCKVTAGSPVEIQVESTARVELQKDEGKTKSISTEPEQGAPGTRIPHERRLALAGEDVRQAAQMQAKPPTLETNSLKVEDGDLVRVQYKASLEDGTLVQTSIPEVAADTHLKRVQGYMEPERPGPVEMLAGEKAVFPGLGNAVIGMSGRENKSVALTPDQAFGRKDPQKVKRFDTVKRIPRVTGMPPQDYINMFGGFPVQGKEVSPTPYYRSRITEITEEYVKLEAFCKDGERVEDEFGATEIHLEGDEVVLTLTPKIGAPFTMKDQRGTMIRGTIAASDGKSFTVDFNHAMAGKPVVLDVELVSFVRASQFEAMQIPWHKDHDKGLDAAEHENKPAVVVLYSPACGWCKRLLNETFEDPRIKVLADKFVWVKVDSQVEKDLYDFYEQDGYPLTVLLSPEGEVIKRISGYRPATALKDELQGVISIRAKGQALTSGSRS